MTAAMAQSRPSARSTPADGAAPSLRRCLATGRTAPKASLVRFVIAPDGAAVPDLAERLPGRGLWISAERAIIDAACRGNKFARAARRPVVVDSQLPATIERQLAARCCDAIRLARRAGHAVFGFERVRTWIARQATGGGANILLLAADSAADAARVGVFGTSSMRIVTSLAGAELGACFAKERVAYAAVSGGGIAARLAIDAGRLAGMRKQSDGMPPPARADRLPIRRLD